MLARPLEPLHQSFFVLGFFEIGSFELFARDWLQTEILLLSTSLGARITGMNHQSLARSNIFF
jgi:hypothetical protein